MRVCRDCGAELPMEHPRYLKGRCRACYNARHRERDARRQAQRNRDRNYPVTDPVAYLLAAMMERALLDLAGFGRPLDERFVLDAQADGVSCCPTAGDCDARDALTWLTGYGADFCELLDVPREWAAMETDKRLMEQEAASA